MPQFLRATPAYRVPTNVVILSRAQVRAAGCPRLGTPDGWRGDTLDGTPRPWPCCAAQRPAASGARRPDRPRLRTNRPALPGPRRTAAARTPQGSPATREPASAHARTRAPSTRRSDRPAALGRCAPRCDARCGAACESHRAIDLLDDRTAEVFAGWLRSHPGVEI